MVNLVYNVILYKDWEQAHRLIDRLDGPGVHFLIHIDRKTDRTFVESARLALASHPNCSFIRRESVHWAAWGLVQVLLNGMRHIREHNIPCDFYIYMSGQDYPLASSRAIADFFDGQRGHQFLEHFPLPYEHWPRQGMDRIESYHFQIRNRHLAYPPPPEQLSDVLRPLFRWLPVPTRRLPGDLIPYGGSAAIILGGNGVDYVDHFVRTPLGRRLVRYFKYTRHADEIFFQTVLLNSPLRDTVVNDELRYVDWSAAEGPPPKMLRLADHRALRDSGKLFARKFSAALDSDILDALDRDIESDTADTLP